MEKALFLVCALIAVGSAISILLQKNPLFSAMSLIGAIVSLSALFIMLHSHFIAAIQIVVYGGAIMVLFVFVIMLLNVPGLPPGLDTHRSLKLLALPAAALMFAEGFFVFRLIPEISSVTEADPGKTFGTTWSIGTALFTDYLLPFELTSVLILMAVVGAIVIARRDVD